jgi:two-component system, LytTR family, response regulator LytT
MRIVIIEDEKITAKDLARTITSIDSEIEIVALLHSVEDAIAFLKNNQVIDLIFSDIQLGDGLSFDIFSATKNQIPIIFCTAYNEYALEAFNTIGIDYLLKPFTKTSVEKALEKYQAIKDQLSTKNNDFSEIILSLKNQINPTKKPSVIVQQGDKIIPLNTDVIALFYIEDDYVFALTFDKTKYLLSQKLEALEKTFVPQFFRANRQFLINRDAVKEASHHFNRKILVHLNVPFTEQILVGKLKITSFLEWLANN